MSYTPGADINGYDYNLIVLLDSAGFWSNGATFQTFISSWLTIYEVKGWDSLFFSWGALPVHLSALSHQTDALSLLQLMELKHNKELSWCIHRPVCTPTSTLIRLHCVKSVKSSVNQNWWTFLHAEFRWLDLYVGLLFFFYIFFLLPYNNISWPLTVQVFFLMISLFYGPTTRQFSALRIHHPECSSSKKVLFIKCRNKTSCHNQHPLQLEMSIVASPQLCRASDHLWTCLVSYKRLYGSGRLWPPGYKIFIPWWFSVQLRSPGQRPCSSEEKADNLNARIVFFPLPVIIPRVKNSL